MAADGGCLLHRDVEKPPAQGERRVAVRGELGGSRARVEPSRASETGAAVGGGAAAVAVVGMESAQVSTCVGVQLAAARRDGMREERRYTESSLDVLLRRVATRVL